MSGPKGHRNLGIRGAVAACQAFLTLINALYLNDLTHTIPTAIFQLISSVSLLTQWRTANPKMFLIRACASWMHCILSLHGASCGRTPPWEDCDDAAWTDIRRPLRVLNLISAIRFLLNGLSLTCQYYFPKRGVGVRGNEQLFYRGIVQGTGIPLNFTKAMLKIGELHGTPYERSVIEIGTDFVRGFILIPIASWSLLNQWVATGVGRCTDDKRTSFQGTVLPQEKLKTSKAAVDTFTDYLEPHKGNRNLLLRSGVHFMHAIVTCWLVGYGIDVPHTLPLACCQAVAAMAILQQWRTDTTRMHLLRATASVVRAALLVHAATCGRAWLWEACDLNGWSDARETSRRLTCLAAFLMMLNGLSLFLQYKYPEKGVTAHHGTDQLFVRGWIRLLCIPLNAAFATTKLTDLSGTPWQRLPVEITSDLFRVLLLNPIETLSLFHQWRYTGTSATDEFALTHRVQRTPPPEPITATDFSSDGSYAVADAATQTGDELGVLSDGDAVDKLSMGVDGLVEEGGQDA
eukprot:CAMPEP_0117620094 /NCGR_PEP_ID=MMETSP0784-20121206/86953_1 /TAXON_ID=39447 /ORGANISM="" /LENGTH=517 /DNA_ID=CAMNT_0005424001 /DNA_START=1 /DNA_END=1554 /DNA_ORIENTATION=-